jgi:transcriptional regulator with XRE-family HTH domain
MEKEKLKNARLSKGLSQDDLAKHLHVTASGYNRREKGHQKILNSEWQKLANALNLSLDDIYEADENQIIICREQSVGINNGTNNVYTIPEFILESQKKYIEKLENENASLKEALAAIKKKS